MTIDDLKAKIKNQTIHLYDSRTMPFDNQTISHFALTDALMNKVGRQQEAVLHFWPTDRLVFLGMQDTRLPYFQQALGVIEEAGYDYVVRNSGGLGVVSDQGITNISLIIPNEDMADISINEGYEIMYDLVQEVIDAPLEAVEIEESYCPGDFDLSIRGQKISGISQRRRSGALAIMLYLSIAGDQDHRSLMMKNFYESGLQGEETPWHFPSVNPEVMTTVSDALGKQIQTEEIEQAFIDRLQDHSFVLEKGEYPSDLLEDYQQHFDQLFKRNQRMLGQDQA